MEHQDWNTVVLRKKAPKSQTSSEAAVADARRHGVPIETVKKFTAGNKAAKNVLPNAKKLEETDELKHERVGHEFKLALQQARLAKGMTQSQLAQAINEKPGIINEYEAGKAIPNPAIITKIERALGARLPRPPKKKAAREEEL
eukprot:GILJ01000561.1.p1 GENE.GILJ01000561.1~~GILJ01000561.1.p1  ORF type:complete len:151 (-),score=28.12 GILJ01000561.1:187-618(-)